MKKKKIILICLVLCIFLLSFTIYKKVSTFTKETQNGQWIIQEIKIKNDYKNLKKSINNLPEEKEIFFIGSEQI